MGTTIFTEMTELAQRTGAINLGQGFPDEDGSAVILDAASAALHEGHNQYAPLSGVPALREAVAAHQRRRYGLEPDPATEVQVTFGATEALAAALLALVGAGDEVVVLDPAYDSYAPIARLAGGARQPGAPEPPEWRLEERRCARPLTARNAGVAAQQSPQPDRPRAGPGRAGAARGALPRRTT